MEEKWIPMTLDPEENKRIIRTNIARVLILNHGERAHLVALEEMMTKPEQEKDWRVILDLIDELTKGESK